MLWTVRLRLRPPPHSPSRTEIFLPLVETPRIGAVVCDRSVSANVRSDFEDLLHTFVSGGKIPFPGRRDAALTRSGARKASEIVMLTFRRLHRSRFAMRSVVSDASIVSSLSHRRPLQDSSWRFSGRKWPIQLTKSSMATTRAAAICTMAGALLGELATSLPGQRYYATLVGNIPEKRA